MDRKCKNGTKNWIGKSEGVEIDFKVRGTGDEFITVFSTRPETIYGGTFIVLAPEHELSEKIATESNRKDVIEYINNSLKKTEIERQSDGGQKTGVFTGRYATNPATGEDIPIWVADYVIGGYGTGAVMAVPAHDERDFDFAMTYELPVVKVIDSPDELYTGDGLAVNSGDIDGLHSSDAKKKIIQWLEVEGIGSSKVTYKIRDWSVSRQRYWGAPIPIINCEKCGPNLVPDSDLPVELPILDDYAPKGDGSSALARALDWMNVQCPSCGGDALRETDTLDTYVCSSWYQLRYFDPHNDQLPFKPEIANKWMPIDFYNGGDHATAHLIYVRFIARFLHRIGMLDTPEPFRTFLFNGKVTASDGTRFSKSKGNGVDPLEIINMGYGADALRIYLMFAAPLDQWIKWNEKGVPAAHKFLQRMWKVVTEYVDDTNEVRLEESLKQKIRLSTNKMIKKVTEDIESSNYNTAIAAIMTCVNDLYRLKKDSFGKNEEWKGALESVVACVAPFAPFIADELWQTLGHDDSVHKDSWPKIDHNALVDQTVTYAVQVNGKLRGTVVVKQDSDKNIVIEAVGRLDTASRYLEDKHIRKIIFVKNKIINFIVDK